MNHDKLMIAAAIGGLATIPYEIISRVLVFLKFGKYSVYQLTSLIITMNRPTVILGMVLAFVVGGFTAVLFYYGLKKLGSDYIIIKSMSVSLLVWVIMEAVFVWLIEGPGLIPGRPINDYYTHMIGSLVFGVTLGILFMRYLFVKTAS